MTQDQARECNKWLFLYLMAATATEKEQPIQWAGVRGDKQCTAHVGDTTSTVRFTRPQSPKDQIVALQSAGNSELNQ